MCACVYLRSNSLEALVWEKEAEVDRFRDRWPMSSLVSRSRMFNLIEENKPRDVIAALTNSKGKGGVALLAEVRAGPTSSGRRSGTGVCMRLLHHRARCIAGMPGIAILRARVCIPGLLVGEVAVLGVERWN